MTFEKWIEENQRPMWDTMSSTELMRLAWSAGFEQGRKEAATECCKLVAERLYNSSVVGSARVIKERFGLEL